ncbi:MAG: phosphatidylserine decarboxylase [Planctomycetes bacterium]|nr:phosphatidylserine decarboxylase [Planctomycetota bacterium]
MTRYAWLEISLTIIVGTGITVVAANYAGWWALLPAGLTLTLLSFYRDPPRRVPVEADLLVAPADGRIVEIARDQRSPDGRERALRIMIFLSVLDVHVNRSPCAGRVLETDYRPGEFLNALRSESSTRNESNALTIAPQAPLPGPVRVRQIAGVLARRIVCAVEPGDELARGQRFGMIKFGSRTEVCVPEDPRWELSIALGEHVKGGLTVLARLRDPAAQPA